MSDRTELFYKIVVPILTLAVGVLIPSWWNSRAVSVQELGVALQMKAAPATADEARQWADRTIAAYTKAEPAKALPPASVPAPAMTARLAAVTAVEPEKICLVPENVRAERREFYIDAHGERLVGQDARVVLMHVIADYRQLAGRYDLVMEILQKTCGFLKGR